MRIRHNIIQMMRSISVLTLSKSNQKVNIKKISTKIKKNGNWSNITKGISTPLDCEIKTVTTDDGGSVEVRFI